MSGREEIDTNSGSRGCWSIGVIIFGAFVTVVMALFFALKASSFLDLPTPTGTSLIEKLMTQTASPSQTSSQPTFRIPSGTPILVMRAPTQPGLNPIFPTGLETPVPAISDPAQFRGFNNSCIDQKYWFVYVPKGLTEPPVYSQNNNTCYDLSSNGLILQNQGLQFNSSSLSSQVFGMYTPLTNTDEDISFKFRINTFTIGNSPTDGIVVFGISDQQDSNFKNGNYLLYGIIYNTHSNNISVEIGSSKTNPAYYWVHPFAVPNMDYNIVFSIRGINLYVNINGETSSYYPRSLSQLSGHGVFWIGYQLPIGKGSFEALLSNFSVVKK